MPSKKKTRKQKILSDTRRTHHVTPETNTYTFRHTPQRTTHPEVEKSVLQPQTIATQHYEYLTHDLKKTLILTIAIIALQLVLRMFVLK